MAPFVQWKSIIFFIVAAMHCIDYKGAFRIVPAMQQVEHNIEQ